MNRLSGMKRSGTTRARKLASIRHFLKFLKDNEIIYGNPADTIEGPIREERDPAILLKTEYKAPRESGGVGEWRALTKRSSQQPFLAKQNACCTCFALDIPWQGTGRREGWKTNGFQVQYPCKTPG